MKSPELSFPVKRHSLQSGSVLKMILYFAFDTISAANACSPKYIKYITENIMKEVKFLIARDNRMFCRSSHTCSVRDPLMTLRLSCPLPSFLCAGVYLFIQQTFAETLCVLGPCSHRGCRAEQKQTRCSGETVILS